MTTLLLVRHGATRWSVTGQHTGRTDLPLTGLGREQARHAAAAVRRIAGDRIGQARVWTSPLRRAVETARLVAGGADPRRCDDLMEYDYGDFEGLTTVQIRERHPGWDIWDDGCPGGEDADRVGARADRFLASIAGSPGPVIAVAHGHLIRILAARALGLPPRQGRLFTLDTAAVSLLETVDGRRAVRLWNVDPALILTGGAPA